MMTVMSVSRTTKGLRIPWVWFAAVLAVGLLLCSCAQAPDGGVPFYEFVDADGVVVVEGVRYVDAGDRIGAMGNPGRWVFTGEVGDAIGVCGGSRDQGGDFTVYSVEGDERQDLLCLRPNRFAFGPYREIICIREGVALEPAAPETVAGVVVTRYGRDRELLEVAGTTDSALIDALLQLYGSQGPEEHLPDGAYEAYRLALRHREYPALFFSLRCSYDTQSGRVYLQCADGVRRRLSPQWEALMTP